MEVLTIIYLTYSFLALYFLVLFTLVYFQNRSRFDESLEIKKNLTLSIVVPCFNAEKTIAKTVEGLLNSNYPGLKKVIVVDDQSTDSSYKILKQLAKKYSRLKVVRTPKNTGRAAGAKNFGAKYVKTDLIGFTDDDSMPRKDAISHMIGYFNDKKVGAVTSRVLVKNRKNYLGLFQAIEYKVIAFTRKLFGFMDAIYVTNGPLSIYRHTAFKRVKGFDMKNLTEDIEITWHIVAKGYKVHMAIPAIVYTVAPSKIKPWFRQRLRWNVGGLQTLIKYKNAFLKCGMLGVFILPFFALSWGLAIFGLGVLLYRLLRSLVVRYLSTSYSIEAQTAILRMSEINLTPSILAFFGFAILILAVSYNLFALSHSQEKGLKKHGLLSIFAYMLFYLTVYPVLLIVSIYKYLRGYNKW